MPSRIIIRLMGRFSVAVDGRTEDWLPDKSPKGTALVELLILHRGEALSRRRLCRELWGDDSAVNGMAALKTLVCRTRQLLDRMSERLGGCIVTEKGGYRWQGVPGMDVDVDLICALCAELRQPMEPARRLSLTRMLIDLYRGDLYLNGVLDSGASMSAWLHRQYLGAVRPCVNALEAAQDREALCEIASAVLRVDEIDEECSLALMRALLAWERIPEARAEYQRISQELRRELGAPPSPELLRMELVIADAERKGRAVLAQG